MERVGITKGESLLRGVVLAAVVVLLSATLVSDGWCGNLVKVKRLVMVQQVVVVAAVVALVRVFTW